MARFSPRSRTAITSRIEEPSWTRTTTRHNETSYLLGRVLVGCMYAPSR